MIFILLIWTAVLIALVVLYLRKKYSRFSDRDVKHLKVVPFFGNMARILFQKDHIVEDLTKAYKEFPDERFIGRYEFMSPLVMLFDLDLVKKVAVKDFEHFLDHRGFIDEEVDPLFGRGLFSLKGEEWKDMRSTLSPAFTSSKIKLMVPFMEEVGQQMVQALKKKIKESGDHIDVDCKDLTTRYANDVIASCAFGLKVDSYTDEKNTFYEMGKSVFSYKLRQLLVVVAGIIFPNLVKKFKMTMLPKKVNDFFINLVLNTMTDRETRNIIRPDMIHLLMEAKKGQLSHDDKENVNEKDAGFAVVKESAVGKKAIDRTWSDTDLVAQAILFFLAGFETISTSMCFALYELARNPDIQEKLAREIKEHYNKNGGKLDFSALQNMSYMDMVTSEVLRLWSPGVAFERVCVKDYNMGKPNDTVSKDFIIKKGEVLWIPAWCFHHDPKYFPNPEKFDPERFSDENKHNVSSMAYMPFGIGPRNCIGSRFALCELKALVYQILLNFEVTASEKTMFTGELDKTTFGLSLKGGHWLRFKIRD